MSSVYFDPAVGGDGSTVTDDSSATTGLANGGHRTRFVPALAQVVAVAANVVAKAAAAAAAAVTAINAPGTQATTTSSLTIGTGSKSLTLAQTGKAFVTGMYVQVVSNASTGNWMLGAITAFNAGTGAMTINVTDSGGSGTAADWTVSLGTPASYVNRTFSASTFNDGYTEETYTANTGTAFTVDLANGSLQILTLTGNCTFTFPTPAAGKSFTVMLKQDATGSRTASWPATAKWPASTAPTITSTASKGDKFIFTSDGTYWWGSNGGQNYL